jgi:sigma-B regulation protein RsbU (phosphoserine phosphatase)
MTDQTTKTSVDDISLLESRINDLSSLIEVSIIVNSTLDLDQVLLLVMEKAQSVMRAEASSVLLVNNETNKLECEVALGAVGEQVRRTIRLAKGQGVAGWVWEHEEPIIVADVSKDKRFFSGIDRKSGFKTQSILAVPLKVQDRIIGVAEVINRVDGRNFTQDDQELFMTFGRQVALAIDNAQMHQLALEQERLRQQLESARIIQQSFMPQILPTSPRGLFELAAKNIPASAVGGDFYDAILLDENRLALLIGDVSGKGVPAALHMARIMSDFRFYVQQESEPQVLLSRLNNLVVERGQRGMFITLQFAIVDLKNKKLSLANGGHLPVLHISHESHRAGLITCDAGAPLGIARDLHFDAVECEIDSGDALFFYTDGLVEMRNKAREQFSLDGLVAVASQKWPSAEALLNTVLESVRDFSDHEPQHDDLTAMAFMLKD